jgi:hypothetical protein
MRPNSESKQHSARGTAKRKKAGLLTSFLPKWFYFFAIFLYYKGHKGRPPQNAGSRGLTKRGFHKGNYWHESNYQKPLRAEGIFGFGKDWKGRNARVY